MLDEYQGLALGIYAGPVEGVAGDDLYVLGEVSLEGGDFGGFA